MVPMQRVRVYEDIRPLSEFRAGVATFVKQIHETRRPMVLTQRGHGVAVLVVALKLLFFRFGANRFVTIT